MEIKGSEIVGGKKEVKVKDKIQLVLTKTIKATKALGSQTNFVKSGSIPLSCFHPTMCFMWLVLWSRGWICICI